MLKYEFFYGMHYLVLYEVGNILEERECTKKEL